ncbi:MAG: hypothetical protein J6K29_04495 [Clostridia bacterium]|nr:hypothetical protein [Clostridia bacterium]
MPDLSIRLADFDILIHARHEYVVHQCKDYLTPVPLTEETADLIVEASSEELAEEKRKNPPHMQESYMESICIYRAICRELPLLGGMLLHSAVISDGTYGYAFTANSGVGKTTHVKLWQKAFGDEISIVNGDKPIIRKKDGTWYAYGTPWCGKEGWNINTSVPLAGICFLRRGETNAIAPFSTESAVADIMPQLLIPEDPQALMATLDMLDGILTEIPLYELFCTISEEAARIARAAMTPAP